MFIEAAVVTVLVLLVLKQGMYTPTDASRDEEAEKKRKEEEEAK